MAMNVAFDTETALIQPGLCLPPVTCGSFAHDAKGFLVHQTDLHPHIKSALSLAATGGMTLIGHNMAFDMGVVCTEYPDLLPLVFRAYEADAICCTEIRQRLIDIADGCYEGFDFFMGANNKITYTLDCTVQRYFDVKLEGKDDIRFGYGALRDVPTDQWTEEQRQYPIDDAIWTLKVFNEQSAQHDAEIFEDQYRQTRAAFWLQLQSAWGLRTDPEYVDQYLKKKLDAYHDLMTRLEKAGFVDAKGKRNTKIVKEYIEKNWNSITAMASGPGKIAVTVGKIPRTEKGEISLAKDTLAKSGDPLLLDYAEYSGTSRSINTNGPILMSGIDTPIHTRYIPIRATGRTSSRKPNIQNQDREEGLRECFTPSRKEWVFIQADWSSFEMVTLAQVCHTVFGYSRLREKLNAGLDPHLEIASLILKEPYDELKERKENKEVYLARQAGKTANFGFPGGLGIEAQIEYAYKLYGIVLTLAESKALKQHWLTAWPEMRDYFRWINTLVGRSKHGGKIQHLFSNRYRGNAKYTAACNSFFQGLAADAAKEAGWYIHKEMYIDKKSPLFGFRGVAFVHDEFIGEGPEDRAPDAAERMSEIMVKIARKWLPDMDPKAEPCVMDRWSKKAKGIRDSNGRLQTYRYRRVEWIDE
jgi:hypothetical protein